LSNKKIKLVSSLQENTTQNTEVFEIDNFRAIDIFGINNKNLKLFEDRLPILVYQKGNQLIVKGEKRYRKILFDAISKTINNQNLDLNKDTKNQMIDNLESQILQSESANQKFSVLETEKQNVIGKSIMQNHYIEALSKNKIIFATGPAGTGKTFLAVAAAVSQLMKNKFNKIILSRPAIEAGERLGFLPGDLKEKVDPYLRPLFDSLYDLLSSETVDRMIFNNEIEIAPLAFMRGRTLNNSFVILDEAQNATHTQIKMFLTRFGKNSRMVVTGDPSQTDLVKREESGW
jgi:Phosphate starvation-inducible protein PhoH, predicted ATPase